MAAPLYIADSFVRADNALTRISAQVSSYVTTGESAMTTISQVKDDLNDMSQVWPIGWLETIQYIDAEAAANASDEAWQDLKRKKDKLVADFQAAKTRFEAIETAIAGL